VSQRFSACDNYLFWCAGFGPRGASITRVMSDKKHIHLIGIGGSAMTPLAGMLKERGYRVTGSDAGVYPPASQFEAWFPSLAHDEESIEQTISAAGESFQQAIS